MHVLAILEDGARAVYHLSGVTNFGQRGEIWLFGTEGTLCYDLLTDRIHGISRRSGRASVTARDLDEIPIPPGKARQWRVEEEFVEAIRSGTPVEFTDFATGVSYMEFTEAVARSAQTGAAVDLPLEQTSS
jgi:predicted dehydrogenase